MEELGHLVGWEGRELIEGWLDEMKFKWLVEGLSKRSERRQEEGEIAEVSITRDSGE